MIRCHFLFTRTLNSFSRVFYYKLTDTRHKSAAFRVISQWCSADRSMKCVTETRSEDITSCSLQQHQPPHINTTEGVKKAKKKSKKEPKKSKKKRKERHAAGCSDSLMTELPFSNTEIWTELGFSGSKSSVKKKRKRGESGRVEIEEDGDKKKKKKQALRPNYFVSVPITNPKIKEAVEEVQKLVLERDVRLSRALIPVDSLHITLLVTHLSTQQQLEVAVSALCGLQDSLNTLLEGRRLVLPFCGVGHFKQEVAFVQITGGDHLITLTHMAEQVRKAFEERGIASADDKAFKPHLTFLKLSRAPKLRKQGVKKLRPTLLSDFESRVFGDECVCRVDLCSMLKKKSADGYYHCEKSVTFTLLQSRHHAARTSGKKAPDDDELVSLSKRLVEDAVLRAVQQYTEETQHNGVVPKDEGPPGPTDTLSNTK